MPRGLKRARLDGAASSSTDPLPAQAPAVGPTAPPRVVLVTHGSFNPVHLGHLDLMTRAKQRLEGSGFVVDAGVLAITRDEHIAKKCATRVIGEAMRLELLALAFSQDQAHGWLSHCGGEGVDHWSAQKYAACKTFQQRHGGSGVALVEGSDVFLKYRNGNRQKLAKGQQLLVAVREGEEEKTEALRRKLTPKLPVGASIEILPPADAKAFSSTNVREMLEVERAEKNKAAVERSCGKAVAEALHAACVSGSLYQR